MVFVKIIAILSTLFYSHWEKETNVKKIGQGWGGSSIPSGGFSAFGQSPAAGIYTLSLSDTIVYRSKTPSVTRGFADEVDVDAQGLVRFLPAAINAKIIAVDKQSYLDIPHIPLRISEITKQFAPNWEYIAQGFWDYAQLALARKSQPAENPFYMKITHPWFTAVIQEVTSSEIGAIQPWTGYLLVESMNTAYVELDPAKGQRRTDILSLHRLSEPLNRRYVVSPQLLFQNRHPAVDLCFHYGLFGSALYFSEKRALWQRGAMFGTLKT